MMARPAGFSSDEDDLCDDYYSNTVPTTKERIDNEVIDLTSKKRDELYMNILNGNLDTVSTCIKDGMSINEILHNDWTPIMVAASVGHFSIVEEFIKLGADVNTNKDRYTVLMAACACPKTCNSFSNSFHVAKLLIDNGANLNAQDRTRMTPLLYAAKSGNLELLEYLLSVCNKDDQDNQGWNVLFWAVNENHVDLVEALINKGFSSNKADVRNNVPLVYAIRQNYEKIIELLPEEHAKTTTFLQSNTYDIEQIFQNAKRPKFQDDVNLILHGMKSETLIPTFQKHEVDLLKFLSLTQAKLQTLGITTPFQQQKLLNGLYKIHKHPYKKKSIPIIDKNHPYSTIDLSRGILTTIRQITVLQATILYLTEQMNEKNAGNFQKEFLAINVIVKKLKGTCKKLKNFAEKCDDKTKPADLITCKSRESLKQKYSLKWCYGIALIGGTIIVAYYKYR